MFTLNNYKKIAAVGIAITFSIPAFSKDELRVCLQEDSAPYSYKIKTEKKGFDVDLVSEIAKKMDRTLKLVWFEGEVERESSDALDANALLSKGKCDLVSGYALFEGSLGRPPVEKSRLPDIEGEPRSKKWITLGVLTASTPYLNAPFTILTNQNSGINEDISDLRELKGYKLAGLHGTLPHLIMMSSNKGYLANDLNNLRWVDDIYGRLDEGNFDAILTELHKFEHYQQLNVAEGIKRTKYRHPLSFNLGFVALEEKSELLRQVNLQIHKMLKSGDIEKISQRNGISYVAPTRPYVLRRDVLMSYLF
ncbi:MAG: transporter substrate-binding domain-containing protein [Neptuniibacter sp.]